MPRSTRKYLGFEMHQLFGAAAGWVAPHDQLPNRDRILPAELDPAGQSGRPRALPVRIGGSIGGVARPVTGRVLRRTYVRGFRREILLPLTLNCRGEEENDDQCPRTRGFHGSRILSRVNRVSQESVCIPN